MNNKQKPYSYTINIRIIIILYFNLNLVANILAIRRSDRIYARFGCSDIMRAQSIQPGESAAVIENPKKEHIDNFHRKYS